MIKNTQLLLLAICSSTFYNAQVGINTTTPQATLHVQAKNENITLKTVNQNNTETLRVQDDGKVSVGDNVTAANGTARLNVSAGAAESALKLIGLPSFADLKNATTRPGITYRNLAPLYVDSSGNVIQSVTIVANSGSVFDGNYSITNAGTLIVNLTDNLSMATFKFYAGAAFGPAGTGAPIYGQISFGYNTGFKVVDFVSSAGGGTLYPNVTATATTNNATSSAALVTEVNINLPGRALTFYYNAADRGIYAKHSDPTAGGLGLTILESRKIR